MRILMLQHSTWNRNYGGSRVQLELAEELRRQGHTVEKWSAEECYPPGSFGHRWPRWGVNQFTYSRRARRFLRREAHRFEVIDALQGNVPFSKTELNFRGLLVCRSVGLIELYERQLRDVEGKLPRAGNPLANSIRAYLARRDQPLYERSLRHADTINVGNTDELACVNVHLRESQRAICLPFGFTEDRLAACARTAARASERWANRTVVFIGLWIRRKGSHQIGDIIRRILATRPDTRFKLLGVGGFPLQNIHADLGPVPLDRVEIIPSFRSEELPALLNDATVGMFPSYVEGFGFALLEKLGCGVPTTAYDAPGSRQLLRELDAGLLVEAGNAAQLADRVIELLALPQEDYAALARRGQRFAAGFRWTQIARDTARLYQEELQRITAV